MSDEYDVGDKVRLAVQFTSAGSPGDPTTVTLSIRAPDGEVIQPVVTRDDVGAYHHDLVLDASGTWHWRWEGAGALTAAGEGMLQARVSVFVS